MTALDMFLFSSARVKSMHALAKDGNVFAKTWMTKFRIYLIERRRLQQGKHI